MKATIWHNPACGTSRKTLEILNDSGADVTVIEYLKQPYERSKLEQLLRDTGMTPKDALRTRGTDAEERGLTEADDATILDAMLANPAYVIPQNLVKVEGRPDLTERGKEMFYVTAGAKINF